MSALSRYVFLLVLALLLAGCGPSGPERYELTGQVTLNGEPVPSGEIIFEPDPAEGNVGPQSRNIITGGSFETEYDNGVVPGAVIATIKPHDGNPHPENRFGLPTHKTVQIHFEMPRENTDRNFEVTDGKPPK